MVVDVGNDPTMPYGSGLQSEHDPYVSNQPYLESYEGIKAPIPTIRGGVLSLDEYDSVWYGMGVSISRC